MRLLIKLFHLWFLISRPMTLGVRALVTDSEGRVLLVRHTYVKGWHLPGGGVDAGEACDDAVLRELREETGITCKHTPTLIGLYFNNKASKRDHVALYHCQTDDANTLTLGAHEIAEAGFFEPDALPEGTTESTRQRLLEVLNGAKKSTYW